MAKRTDQNKDKTSRASLDPNHPSTSTEIPKTTVLNKTPNKNQKIKKRDKFMAEKTEANISKLQVPLSFEGEIAKIKITMPLIELITQSS